MRKHKETLDSGAEFTGSIISAATAMLVAKQLPLELNSVQATRITERAGRARPAKSDYVLSASHTQQNNLNKMAMRRARARTLATRSGVFIAVFSTLASY